MRTETKRWYCPNCGARLAGFSLAASDRDELLSLPQGLSRIELHLEHFEIHQCAPNPLVVHRADEQSASADDCDAVPHSPQRA